MRTDHFHEVHTGGRYARFLPKIGMKFGELSIMAVIKTGMKIGSVCVVRCECGREEAWVVSILNKRVRYGGNLCCKMCSTELKTGRHIESVDKFNEYLRHLWDSHKTLWDPRSIDKLTTAIEDALVSEFGAKTAETHRPDSYHNDWMCGRTHAAQQRMAYMYPMAAVDDDKTWQCHICEQYVDRGFGCVNCLEFACIGCVASEKHKCIEADDGMTLDGVGEALCKVSWGRTHKYSRERIRQMVSKAMRKLNISRHLNGLSELI